jgi:hypothetical protein
MTLSKPTAETYEGLQAAYDFFNVRLFGGSLPPCLLTLQRTNRTYGYFSGNRWTDRAGQTVTDEIALNPMHFLNRSTEAVLSTLVHEMVHLWQHHYGKPSRSAYHNREWAAHMKAVGLQPSDTGQPGGKETGQQVTHYVIAGGPFAVACADLMEQRFNIPYGDRAGEQPKAKGGKSGLRYKFTCAACGLNAWSKPDAVLICGACVEVMTPQP